MMCQFAVNFEVIFNDRRAWRFYFDSHVATLRAAVKIGFKRFQIEQLSLKSVDEDDACDDYDGLRDDMVDDVGDDVIMNKASVLTARAADQGFLWQNGENLDSTGFSQTFPFSKFENGFFANCNQHF